ncbi:hypothetical protein DOK_04633 [gamma proteobacterium BDW918]|jgi:uncharacterized membrane protein YkvA (DUF1232 family)|uniref:DUF1232 domain-containing protein n=1 Tax=Zhongshania aliphaticivorans TaxID=1470434 RepID=A0A127M4T5_9GAMM|nr:YkvA family protein [Zhongshania aliphaticivorans]AMO68259.1 hypothetical protein AZF00_08070 [Zhongshania aliphaticivorans]EIF44152.1 hypothetical protein DOK_04633 [gamma proteobacterium BDW918]
MLFFSKKRAKHVLDEGAAELDDATLQKALSNRQGILNRVTNNASLAPYINQVKILFNLVQDYVKGDYREVPWWSLGSISTALLYILMPMDALPDYIPVAGFLDDAVVLKLCLDMVAKDLTKYLEFKQEGKSPGNTATDNTEDKLST